MKTLMRILVAAVMGVGFTVALLASPAQAAGWSGQRCDQQNGSAARVCINVHTIPYGNGYRVDQTQVCAYKVPQTYYNGFRGTKGNSIQFRGSGGAMLGWVNLNDTGASIDGSCSLTNSAFQLGGGACYHAYGTMDLAGYNDGYWGVDGRVLGGAC